MDKIIKMKIDTKLDVVDLMKHLELPLVAAEVGVAEGRYSLDLLQRGIEKLYLIDIWEKVPFIDGCASWEQEWHDDNYNAVLDRTKDYKENIVILKGLSYKMAEHIPDDTLGLLFIDADHSYNGVKTDLEYFWGKLVVGGILILHDFANPEYGVWRAGKEFSQKHNLEVNLLKENNQIDNIGCYMIKQ